MKKVKYRRKIVQEELALEYNEERIIKGKTTNDIFLSHAGNQKPKLRKKRDGSNMNMMCHRYVSFYPKTPENVYL